MPAGKKDQYSNQVFIVFESPEFQRTALLDELDQLLNELRGDPVEEESADDAVMRNTTRLMLKAHQHKWNYRSVKIPRAATVTEAAKLVRGKFQDFWDTRTRVYLIGHGDWQVQTIGTFGAGGVARVLTESGMPKVSVISVIACELGRGINIHQTFAGNLQARLFEYAGIQTVIYARMLPMLVADGGSKETYLEREGSYEAKREGAKVKWTWSGRTQRVGAVVGDKMFYPKNQP